MNNQFSYLKWTVVLAAFLMIAISPQGVNAQLNNDDFIDATEITSLPFVDYASVDGKTLEEGELALSLCLGAEEPLTWSYWYKITPSGANTYFLDASSYVSGPAFVSIYTGSSLSDLELWDCLGFEDYGASGSLEFDVVPVFTYYIQISGEIPSGDFWMSLDQQLPLTADFRIQSGGLGKSIFDTITFRDESFDPLEIGIQMYDWDFGDGMTDNSSLATTTHRYQQDGEYTVTHKITTFDGRQASASKTISISTHDVVVTHLNTPEVAKSGETRRIEVYVANPYFPEVVFINLEKFPGEKGGSAHLQPMNVDYPFHIPVTPLNHPIIINFEYTFTPWDAEVGLVTFVARVDDMWWQYPFLDCCTYNDELRSPPVRVIK